MTTRRFNCFADWCLHKDDLSPEVRHTVEVLLELAGTSDYDEAERVLSSRTKLSFNQKRISDITPLSSLTQLTQLSLFNLQISDITPLSDLTNLTELYVYDSQISDITPLSGLTQLTALELECSQISDITPLSGLTQLTYLTLNGNQISDITPLSSLTNLTKLCLEHNQISDITPLSGLTNLRELYLHNNQISGITLLSGLTNLRGLYLHNNQISDITPVFGLTNLTKLVLDNSIPNLNLPKALQNQWRNLSTEPIARQQATVAVKSAYAIIGFTEPEIIFCSSPYQGFASFSECESLGSSLAQVLSDAARKPPIWGLWQSWRELMAFQSGWEVHRQLKTELQYGGIELESYKDDGLERERYITPEELVELISITEFYVSEFDCLLEDKEQEVLRCLKLIFESCGWIFPYENVCVVCDRPRILSFDNQERLHAEGSPAVQFADGWSVYAYHGVRLPEEYGKVPPNQWQAQWLLEEKNAELRRALIQGIGYDRICQELQAIELDSWQEYTLLKIESDVDLEPIYLLKMTCPSTGYIHALRVPPDMKSAREAISWVNWGITPDEFSVQT